MAKKRQRANTWRKDYKQPPDNLTFLGWIVDDEFKTADNEGFWYIFSASGYDWMPVWGAGGKFTRGRSE